MKLIVLGIGTVKSGPRVIFALARHFGERPLDIVFWDPSEERLDLFETFARKSMDAMKNGHQLTTTTDLSEALKEDGRFLILAEGKAWDKLVDHLPFQATYVASSDGAGRPETLAWPEPLQDDPQAVAFQMLRWINGEEYLPNVIEAETDNLFSDWLKRLV